MLSNASIITLALCFFSKCVYKIEKVRRRLVLLPETMIRWPLLACLSLTHLEEAHGQPLVDFIGFTRVKCELRKVTNNTPTKALYIGFKRLQALQTFLMRRAEEVNANERRTGMPVSHCLA